ncbi:uncharacterized protein EDB91DRAFT_1157148 [Suillus paluster]|uniref:uncharacterized protein n=1 Tax=Suillus paluster TaxID=48578 RepID=UPI001B87B2CC|nr:uncharacterized protein EDB91DRAFT_1157148 [Suillus paluster]KAG1730380.1 hypothetical protein EDB91DRAFT_1157148 [Suillus paluster]
MWEKVCYSATTGRFQNIVLPGFASSAGGTPSKQFCPQHYHDPSNSDIPFNRFGSLFQVVNVVTDRSNTYIDESTRVERALLLMLVVVLAMAASTGLLSTELPHISSDVAFDQCLLFLFISSFFVPHTVRYLPTRFIRSNDFGPETTLHNERCSFPA